MLYCMQHAWYYNHTSVLVRLILLGGESEKLRKMVCHKNELQWNPSVTGTFGDQHFVCNSEVSPTQGLPVYFR